MLPKSQMSKNINCNGKMNVHINSLICKQLHENLTQTNTLSDKHISDKEKRKWNELNWNESKLKNDKLKYVQLKSRPECVALVKNAKQLDNGVIRYRIEFKNKTRSIHDYFLSELVEITKEFYEKASENFTFCVDMRESLYHNIMRDNKVAVMILNSIYNCNYRFNSATALNDKIVRYEVIERLDNCVARFFHLLHDIRKEIETRPDMINKPKKHRKKKRRSKKNKNKNTNNENENENDRKNESNNVTSVFETTTTITRTVVTADDNVPSVSISQIQEFQASVIVNREMKINENENKEETGSQRKNGVAKLSKQYAKKRASRLKRETREARLNEIKLECECGNFASNNNLLKFIGDVDIQIKNINYHHDLNGDCDFFDINKDIDQQCVNIYHYLRYFGLHYHQRNKNENKKMFDGRDGDADRIIMSWLLETFNKELKGKYLAFVKYFESHYTSIIHPMKKWCVERSVINAQDTGKAILRHQWYGCKESNLTI